MIRTPLALHLGSPNVTEASRPMVVMGYVMRWLQTPNVELDVPRSFYEALPAKTQQLLRCNVVDELPADNAETYVEFAY